MKIRTALTTFVVTASLVILFATPANLRAATLTVASTADSGPGSLRTALKNSRSGDTIKLSVTGTILLTSGELVVSKSVSILGPGADSLALNGNHASRVFHIAPGTTVTIAGLTIANGLATGKFDYDKNGGGIFNEQATLTLIDCTLTGNTAGGYNGGGIYILSGRSPATLTLINSVLSRNSAYDGGGIYTAAAGTTVEIINSTLTGNTANRNGGGINNSPGCTMTLRNSTLSGNTCLSSGGAGGGIWNYSTISTLTLKNCTVSGNSAYNRAGGIVNYGGMLVVLNCTIAGNFGYGYAGGIANTIYGTVQIGSTILNNNVNLYANVISLGYNLCSDDGGGVLTNPTDQINTDPQLGPLQDNGGPTWTHAPVPTSPAIDRGFNFSGSPTDQRGGARTVDYSGVPNAPGGNGTDIGAVEVQ